MPGEPRLQAARREHARHGVGGRPIATPRAAQEDAIGDDREVIRGDQRALRRINESHSAAHSPAQARAQALRGTQRHSEALRGNQEAIKRQSSGNQVANDTHLLRREHGHSDRSWLLRRNNQPPRPQVLIDNLILEHASQLVAEKGDARYLWGGEGAVVSTCMQGACAARRGNRGRARFLTALVISGHQWSSVVISGHQWSSVAISGHQWSSGYARYLSARYAHVEPHLGRRG